MNRINCYIHQILPWLNILLMWLWCNLCKTTMNYDCLHNLLQVLDWVHIFHAIFLLTKIKRKWGNHHGLNTSYSAWFYTLIAWKLCFYLIKIGLKAVNLELGLEILPQCHNKDSGDYFLRAAQHRGAHTLCCRVVSTVLFFYACLVPQQSSLVPRPWFQKPYFIYYFMFDYND